MSTPATAVRPESCYATETARLDASMAAPAWLTAYRTAARERFESLGFPTTRDEDFKFTSFKALQRQVYHLEPASDPAITAADIAPYILPDAWRLVVVNGRVNWELSHFGELPEGSGYGDLNKSVELFPERWESVLTRRAVEKQNAFEALNTAGWQQGAFVWLAQNAQIATPIQILYVAAAGEEPYLQIPRTTIVLEENVKATIVQTFASKTGGLLVSNAVTEIHLREGAQLDHYHVQRGRSQAISVGTVHAWQERNSIFTSDAITLGSQLTRSNLDVDLAGEGATCQLNGLFVLDGDRHADIHSIIDHQVPNTHSSQLFKGILDDESHGVFTGKVIVRPDAQKITAEQSNPNLLLSEDCVINSQPQLEIYADDVKAAHGATIGQLDEDALFYLRSRGIAETAAKAILTYAFASDLINRMHLEPLKAQLAEVLVGELVHGDIPTGLTQIIGEEADQ